MPRRKATLKPAALVMVRPGVMRSRSCADWMPSASSLSALKAVMAMEHPGCSPRASAPSPRFPRPGGSSPETWRRFGAVAGSRVRDCTGTAVEGSPAVAAAGLPAPRGRRLGSWHHRNAWRGRRRGRLRRSGTARGIRTEDAVEESPPLSWAKLAASGKERQATGDLPTVTLVHDGCPNWFRC